MKSFSEMSKSNMSIYHKTYLADAPNSHSDNNYYLSSFFYVLCLCKTGAIMTLHNFLFSATLSNM